MYNDKMEEKNAEHGKEAETKGETQELTKTFEYKGIKFSLKLSQKDENTVKEEMFYLDEGAEYPWQEIGEARTWEGNLQEVDKSTIEDIIEEYKDRDENFNRVAKEKYKPNPDFDDLEEIETVKYRWTCPVCGKQAEGSTEGQAKSHAKQHYYSRHD